MSIKSLEYLLSPRSIAVFGIEEGGESHSPATLIVKNLLTTNFNGPIFPISKGLDVISGLITYPALKQTPRPVDLAVLAGRPEDVPRQLEECGKAGVKGALVIASDFRHRVEAPDEFVSTVKQLALRYGIRCIGPNSTGVIRPRMSLHVSTVMPWVRGGRTAFLSQSATFGSAILEYAKNKHIGFSTYVALGAQADVDVSDLLDFLAMDPDTKAVVIYLESIFDGRSFMSAARAISRIKPIVVVKGGRFQDVPDDDLPIGIDKAYDAVFARAGIVRVEDALELFNVTECLAKQPSPKGNRLFVVTNAGGPATMATDTLLKYGGRLADMGTELEERLNEILPRFWSKGNPIDCLSDASPKRIKRVLEAVMEYGEGDGILTILTPQYATQPMETAKYLVELKGRYRRGPQFLACFMGMGEMEKARGYLNEMDVPTFVAPEQAVKSFVYTFRHRYNLMLQQETPASLLEDFMPDAKAVEELLNRVLGQGRRHLFEWESKKVLEAYGIRSPKLVFVRDKGELSSLTKGLKFPVAMKIESSSIKSKALKGLMRLHVGKRSLEQAFDDLVKRAKELFPDIPVAGVIIQPMVYWPGQEVAFGTKKDPIFGSLIFFGIGGRLFYTLGDYAVGLPPLNQTLAKRLMEQTQVYAYLRDSTAPRYNLPLLEQVLLRFSQLVVDFPQIDRAEINSFYLGEKEGLCLDARIVLDEGLGRKLNRAQGPCCPSNLIICPYPCHFIEEERMRDGTPFLVRPIRPEDEPKMYELFKTFSPQTIRMRFFQDIKEIPHEQMVRYCQIDYDREIALVAAINQGASERFIGVGRLTILPDRETSEFAVVVGDPWQKKGIGRILTKRCLEIAKSQGVKRVFMDVLSDNVAMRRMAERMGFKEIKSPEEDIVRYVLELEKLR